MRCSHAREKEGEEKNVKKIKKYNHQREGIPRARYQTSVG
jgi:hypothetical protein